MPTTWSSEMDLQLLLAVIGAADVKPSAHWPAIAQHLGQSLTAEAVRQRYQKLKKIAAATASAETTGTASTPTGTAQDYDDNNSLPTPKTPKSSQKPRAEKRKQEHDEPEQTPKKRGRRIKKEPALTIVTNDEENGKDIVASDADNETPGFGEDKAEIGEATP